MKSIRPLFRSNGRFGIPQSHGEFQQWIGDPLRGRHKTPLEASRGTFQVVQVKRPHAWGPLLVGNPTPKYASVPGIISRARTRRRLLEHEAEFLRSFLVKTCAQKTYREWLSSSGLANFFREDDWSDQDNHRKFALYVLACFVDFFRPGEIDWRTPNLSDMQLVAKLLRIFADSTDRDKQKRLLRGLFDVAEDLRSIAVETATGLSRKDQELLLECDRLRLKGESRARWLQERGFKGFGKSVLTKFRQNPNSMRAQISTWTREILHD
jgi:hypothetical protein